MDTKTVRPIIATIKNNTTGQEVKIKEELLKRNLTNGFWTSKDVKIISCSKECKEFLAEKEAEAQPVNRIIGLVGEKEETKSNADKITKKA